MNLYHIVLVLFYNIIFYAIGYDGDFTDYSMPGWPIRHYSILSL